MPNPAVTFRPSGPPTGGEGYDAGPLPVVKVDLTPPSGSQFGDTATPPPTQGQPRPVPRREGEPPEGSPRRLIQEVRRYRRQAYENRMAAQQASEEKAALEQRLAQAAANAEWVARWDAADDTERVRMAHARGLTYDKHTQTVLKGEVPPDPVRDEVQKAKEDLLALRQELEEERRGAAEATFRASIQSHVIRNPNRYPLIRQWADQGTYDEVFDLCRMVYENGWPERNMPRGSHLSIKAAAREVEGYLDKLHRRAVSYMQERVPRSDGQRRPPTRPYGENVGSRVPTRGFGAPATERGGLNGRPRAVRPPFSGGLSNRYAPSAASFDRSRPARNESEREARALAILRGQIPA